METEAGVTFVETNAGSSFFGKVQRPFEQLSFIFYITDTESKSNIAFVYNFFDPRGVYTASVQNDTYTDFVSAPLAAAGSQFLTLAADSVTFQSKPMKNRAKFHITMTQQNLLNAINAVNAKGTLTSTKLSLDPKKYMVTLVNVFFELPNYVPRIITNAAVSIKGFKVQISSKPGSR